MQNTEENFIPILFQVLFGLVILNLLTNFVLLYTRNVRMNKLMVYYWLSLLSMYLLQGFFQQGHLNIVLAYAPGFITILVMARITFEVTGRHFPLKKYIYIFLPSIPITLWLNTKNVSFTTLAMPLSLAMAVPLFHSVYYLNIVDRKKTTRLQKVMGLIVLANAVHVINFAIFRMDPGAQLWGWIVSFALCNSLAIILPSMSLEYSALTENDRLQNLVDEKIIELNKSLQVNEKLVTILIHDISNPLMVMKNYLYLFKQNRLDKEMIIQKIERTQIAMENIILQAKNLHRLKNKSAIPLKATSITECFKEVSFIFEAFCRQKHITLKFDNQLSSDSLALADQTTLIHSVISNFLSNAIKFSPENAVITVSAIEEDEHIIILIEDQGPGIPAQTIKDVISNKEPTSTLGSAGEKGSGLGLSIAKTFVEFFGGRVDFMSKADSTGAIVRVTLEKALPEQTSSQNNPKEWSLKPNNENRPSAHT